MPASRSSLAAPLAAIAVLGALFACAPPAHAEGAGGPGDVRYNDANSDRVILYSTAETHPAGTVFFSDYEIVLLQIGYAITDSLQLSISGVPPLVSDQPYFFDVTAKLNLLRGDLFRAAVQIAGDGLFVPNSNPSSVFGLRIGGIGQLCFQPTCLSSLTLNAGTLLNNQLLNSGHTVLPIYLGAGLTLHATDLIKILVEPNYAIAYGDGSISGPHGFLLNYGIRLSGKQFGFDLAFVKPFGGDTSGGIVMGFPVISFTYRTEPPPAAPR